MEEKDNNIKLQCVSRENLLGSLECRICTNIRVTKQFMCSNRHTICHSCFNKLAEVLCPWCRVPFASPPERDFELEAQIRQHVKDANIQKCQDSNCDHYFSYEEEMAYEKQQQQQQEQEQEVNTAGDRLSLLSWGMGCCSAITFLVLYCLLGIFGLGLFYLLSLLIKYFHEM